LHFTGVYLKRKAARKGKSRKNTFKEVHKISVPGKDDAVWMQDALIAGKLSVSFELDSGSKTDAIPVALVKELNTLPDLVKTQQRIVAYGKFKLKPVGSLITTCKIGSLTKTLTFLVVPEDVVPVLSLKTCLALNLISRNEVPVHNISVQETPLPSSKEEFCKENADLFEGQGKFPGQVSLMIDKNVQPKVFPPRRTAKAVKDKLKSYLDQIEGEIGIKEDKPMSWVSNMLIREKPDGDVRLCLDPNFLIFGKTYEAHDKAFREVIKRARLNNVKFNMAKLQYRVVQIPLSILF